VANITTQIDWQNWLRRWDAMQTAYIPEREERFTTMLDILDALLPETLVAVDLGAGPGAISRRLLERFPQARCVAVDYDPVLLAMGRAVLDDAGGRLRWVEADLRAPTWLDQVGEKRVDAVLSTTALHWLEAGDLVRLYHQLGALVRPDGLVLNGDHLRLAPHLSTFQALFATLQQRQREEVFVRRGAEGWRQWWDALAQEPALRELLAERERRLGQHTDDDSAPILEVHEAALHDAGFREVGLVWQRLGNGILMAVR
jgi:trans-aconitate methyltransferase